MAGDALVNTAIIVDFTMVPDVLYPETRPDREEIDFLLCFFCWGGVMEHIDPGIKTDPIYVSNRDQAAAYLRDSGDLP